MILVAVHISPPSPPSHAPDVNDFLSQSGWFSYPGLAHGKKALQHVLAKKMKLNFEEFMGVKEAVYMLKYRQGEKVRPQEAALLFSLPPVTPGTVNPVLSAPHC